MAIPTREQNILFARSGNICAFPECGRVLAIDPVSPGGEPVILGEMAHIVAERPGGPRGDSPMTLEERNRYENLILLCNIHHQLIDDNPQTYTVERLLQIKQDHEAGVQKALTRGRGDGIPREVLLVTETVHSTLLPVERMPTYVYTAPCELRDEEAVRVKLKPLRRDLNEMAPFLLRAGMLIAFQDLQSPDNPFSDVIAPETAQRHLSRQWWVDPDKMSWFVSLLNRALNKVTGRAGLRLDSQHHRYYFQGDEPGKEPPPIRYKSLNGRNQTRKVVWEPKNKRTGLGRGYWLHRAVALHFVYLGGDSWCLNIRPELRVTEDGFKPLESERIGTKVTRAKARRFNYDLLNEVHFWRDFLSGSSPRIIMRFGPSQSIIVQTTLAHGTVVWPGIPEEHAKPFRNVEYLDDLFTWAERAEVDREAVYGDGEDDDYDEDLDNEQALFSEDDDDSEAG